MKVCSVEDCDRPYYAIGYCFMHRARFLKHGTTDLIVREARVCSVDDCDKPHHAHGYCSKHARRFKRIGSAQLPAKKTLDEKIANNSIILSNVDCIEWSGNHDKDGYSLLYHNGQSHRVHNLVWTQNNGDIPDGKEVDHKCINTGCINIKHLQVVTHALNAQNRKLNKTNKSGYRGVFLNKKSGKWIARVTLNKKSHHIGTFDTAEEAGKAASAWRRENMPNSLMDQG